MEHRAGPGEDLRRTAVGGPPQVLDLGGAEPAIGRGRDFARRTLAAWQWPEQARGGVLPAEDVVLLVSELVTNATVHGGGIRDLRLEALPGMLRIEVRDQDATPPRLREGVPGRPGGYGLNIVERLAADWGHRPEPGAGKTVWVLVPAPWSAD